MKKDSTRRCPCQGGTLVRFVQPIILFSLADAPDHGYDLLQKIARTQLWQDAPPDAAGVYRVLRDMESRGLIRSHMDSASKAAIGKRVFEITDAGRICMKNWIETLEQYRRGIDEVILHLRESLSDPPVPDGVSSPTAENLCCCCVSAAVSKP